jgi:hypothetical protein
VSESKTAADAPEMAKAAIYQDGRLYRMGASPGGRNASAQSVLEAIAALPPAPLPPEVAGLVRDMASRWCETNGEFDSCSDPGCLPCRAAALPLPEDGA